MKPMESFTEKWFGFQPEILPEQFVGRMLSARSTKTFADTDAANMAYLKARERLLNVNEWGAYTNEALADFQLVDENGEKVSGKAAKGLRIRIDIPGPGTFEGEGFDWALIEEMEEDAREDLEYVAFRVRPAANPEKKKSEVAHFYNPQSTSTMVVYRDDLSVTCAIYDRNLSANTEHTTNLADKMRNAVVGNLAASGLSGVQWQALVDALWGEMA
ncbi:hypothetical protein [Ravibacter arvi]